jgi:hypothetical protein
MAMFAFDLRKRVGCYDDFIVATSSLFMKKRPNHKSEGGFFLFDRLCLERGLSVIKEPSAQTRFTLAKQSLLEKGKSSWKDEIREKFDELLCM